MPKASEKRVANLTACADCVHALFRRNEKNSNDEFYCLKSGLTKEAKYCNQHELNTDLPKYNHKTALSNR